MAKKDGLTCSVHRRGVILCFSPYSMMNVICILCVYPAIFKHEGAVLRFPWSKEASSSYSEASEPAMDENAKNEVFNYCSHGDVLKWKHFWKLVAENVDICGVMMKDIWNVWDKIVKQNNLVPAKLDDIGAWWFVDHALSIEYPLDTMNKNKEHGFSGFQDYQILIHPLGKQVEIFQHCSLVRTSYFIRCPLVRTFYGVFMFNFYDFLLLSERFMLC
ncbi:hypothetical protein POM88_043438 [Heracleum sosnowskyi]|uniref:Uncharacterized protein n=1 Tax=Heracleum sosnowskyi TaxID=360622 RepID=A0AAD8H3D0_9APIA|nr:hypothetical protein POM88_043438 [Heracleum sosnowskyi]